MPSNILHEEVKFLKLEKKYQNTMYDMEKSRSFIFIEEKEWLSSLSNQAYTILKQRIVERQLKPGAKLDLAAIEAELKVSRMPILAALTRLEHEGLVTIRNRVSTFSRRWASLSIAF